MINTWITVNESVINTGKSEITIRRYISEHKHNKNIIKKEKGKVWINPAFLYKLYPTINNISDDISEENKHKKEAMQIVYNSEALKAQSENLIAKDQHISQLINRKSYTALYVCIGFIVLILVFGALAWLYRSEILENHKKEINILTSISGDIKQVLQETKSELKEAKEDYRHSIKNIEQLHDKYSSKLEDKEKIYAADLLAYKKDLEIDQGKIKALQMQIEKLTAVDSQSSKAN